MTMRSEIKLRYSNKDDYLDYFEGKKSLSYSDRWYRHMDFWHAYWICSVSDIESIKTGGQINNTGLNVNGIEDWFDLMSCQFGFEDQACDSNEGKDVSINNSVNLNGLEIFAPVQFYVLNKSTPIGAAINLAGVPDDCHVWTRNGSKNFCYAMLTWRQVDNIANSQSCPFDIRLKQILGNDNKKAKVMFVTQGLTPNETPRDRRRMEAWRKFGFIVDERVPPVEEVVLQHGSGSACVPNKNEDRKEKDRELKLSVDEQRLDHHFMFYVTNPYEPGYIHPLIGYFAALAKERGHISTSISKPLQDRWVIDMTIRALKLYLEKDYIDIGVRYTRYGSQINGNGILPSTESPQAKLRSIAESLSSGATNYKTQAAWGTDLMKWGILTTEKGWRHRLEIESTLEEHIKYLMKYGDECTWLYGIG